MTAKPTTPSTSPDAGSPANPRRKRYMWLGLAVVLLALAVISGAVAYRNTRTPPPNIVFILVDTLRADHLQPYGYGEATAPRLQQLADQGVLFERVIAPSSWTKSSMASIITSRNPSGSGVLGVRDVLPEHLVTLAEGLKAGGYETIAINTNPWLQSRFGYHRGFDRYEMLPFDINSTVWHVNKLARKFLKARESDAPLFLYLHLMDTHSPYFPAAKYFQAPLLTLPGLGTVDHARLNELYRKSYDESYRAMRDLDAPHVRQRVIDLYDAEIKTVDDGIGQFIDRMKAMGYDHNTVFIIASDHGEAFREHGTTEHGWNLYPEVYGIPLIFHAPGMLPEGLRISAQVRGIDIAPTIYDIAGVPTPTTVEGEPLLPMADGQIKDRPAVAAVGYNDHIPDLHYIAVVTNEHLYVREKTNDVVEFYDLRTDPGALDDLGRAHPDIRMYVRIAELEERTTPTEKADLDPELMRQLKSLGYF